MGSDLIITRTGPASLHQTWVESDPSRDWDLYLCPYTQAGAAYPTGPGITIGEVIPGQKWTGLRALLHGWQGWRKYRYIVLADDDLFTMPWTWSRFFDVAGRVGAKLGAPALTEESFASYWVTQRNTEFVARRVSFVEIMTPCFHVDTLIRLLPTLDQTETGLGWGLDFVWPKLLSYQDIFVIDGAPIAHTRPGQYTNRELVDRGRAEMDRILAQYDARLVQRTFAGIDMSGSEIPESDPAFLYRMLRGYTRLLDHNPAKFREIFENQLQALPGA